MGRFLSMFYVAFQCVLFVLVQQPGTYRYKYLHILTLFLWKFRKRIKASMMYRTTCFDRKAEILKILMTFAQIEQHILFSLAGLNVFFSFFKSHMHINRVYLTRLI